MFIHAYLLATLAAGAATPALAEIVITQQKAIAGNITPGDQPGFPITLSSFGNYSFGGNIVVAAGKNGIEITAADVTIDLNGSSGGWKGAAESGIVGSKRAATILNGTIIGFGEDGINSEAPFWIIRDMRVINSKGFNAVGCGPSAILRAASWPRMGGSRGGHPERWGGSDRECDRQQRRSGRGFRWRWPR